MPTRNHDSYRQYFRKLTRFGVLQWRRTADHNETFTTKLKGLFVATVGEDRVSRYLRMENSGDGAQYLLTSADSEVVDALFADVRSRAFNLHGAIAPIGRLDS